MSGEPQLKDSGPDDPVNEVSEPVVDIMPSEFPWEATDDDEIRRAWIITFFAAPEIDSKINVEAMERVFQWMKNGTLEKVAVKKTALKAV